MIKNFKDTPESLAAEIRKWAENDIDNVGRDVLKRAAREFAKRVKALAFSVPEIEIAKPDGKAVSRGFYFEMPAYQRYPDDPGETPVRRYLVEYSAGDWGLDNTPRMRELRDLNGVRPSGRFVSLVRQSK